MDADALGQSLAHHDAILDDLLARATPERRARLDRSPASLNVPEAWLLKTFPDPAAARAVNLYLRLLPKRRLAGAG